MALFELLCLYVEWIKISAECKYHILLDSVSSFIIVYAIYDIEYETTVEKRESTINKNKNKKAK